MKAVFIAVLSIPSVTTFGLQVADTLCDNAVSAEYSNQIGVDTSALFQNRGCYNLEEQACCRKKRSGIGAMLPNACL